MPEPRSALAAALADRYRIERDLGQGGMATVYLAQDLKHDRKVAIKVLRPELAAVIGAERFLSEIKTTANLQHPHILPLFDSGAVQPSHPERSEGSLSFLYYVMPYVEGESLRDRLTREKQLPIPDAVRIATEVASALDYAHRHGVLHRDIKPENILLHDGQALVADFGIALAMRKAGGARLTETGLSLGTPQYMSPEQATAERELDARTDIYALGAVTYEMLTGEPPFMGSTSQAIIAKLMTETPRPPSVLRKAVPPAVEAAVLTALEKLPADRFASAAEYVAALNGSGPLPPGRTTAHQPGKSPARLRPSAVIAVSLATACAALALGYRVGWQRGHTAVLPSRLSMVGATVGGSGVSGAARQLTMTPDGETVIFVGQDEGGDDVLMRRRLDDLEASIIPGTSTLLSPQVSPDGRWIIASTPRGEAVELSIEGGTVRTLPAPVTSAHAAWSRDGTFWFNSRGTDLYRLREGGSITAVFPSKTRGLRIQQILDDGHTALVVRTAGGASSGPGELFDLETGIETALIEKPVVEMRYTSGYLIDVEPSGTLMAVPFDPHGLRMSGVATQLATGVGLTGTGTAQLAVAPTGTVAYVPEAPNGLVFVDRAGSIRPALSERHNFHAPKFSPDGRRLTTDFTTGEGRNVWILSLAEGALTRATFERDGHDATWALDGRSILYTSLRSGVFGVYRTRPGSAQPPDSLLASPNLSYTGQAYRGGAGLLTVGKDLQPGSGTDIAMVENGGQGPITPLAASSFTEQYPAPSPDGQWMAFVSDQSGEQQVYIRPLRRQGDMVQVSLDGGSEPVWGPDGRELFYRGVDKGQAVLASAGLRLTPEVSVLARRTLFPIDEMVGTTTHANYDIAPDGRTFVMVQRSPANRIMVIQNLPGLVSRMRGSNP
jgi:serine/threonine-protein kinase